MIQTIRSFFFPTVDSITASVSKQVDRLHALADAQKAQSDAKLSQAATLIAEANATNEQRKRALTVAGRLSALVA